jgi:hypothetical protein
LFPLLSANPALPENPCKTIAADVLLMRVRNSQGNVAPSLDFMLPSADLAREASRRRQRIKARRLIGPKTGTARRPA